MMGALVGVVLGLANFVVLRMVAERLGAKPGASGQRGGAQVVMAVAWADLALLPVIGYLVGPMVLS